MRPLNNKRLAPLDRELTADEVLQALVDLQIEIMEYGSATVLCGTYYSRALIVAERLIKQGVHHG